MFRLVCCLSCLTKTNKTKLLWFSHSFWFVMIIRMTMMMIMIMTAYFSLFSHSTNNYTSAPKTLSCASHTCGYLSVWYFRADFFISSSQTSCWLLFSEINRIVFVMRLIISHLFILMHISYLFILMDISYLFIFKIYILLNKLFNQKNIEFFTHIRYIFKRKFKII